MAMSSKKDTTYYMELQPGDAVQDGDQWLDSFGQWQPYVCNDQISGVVFAGVKARRPIRTTHQTTYEEVPGSRTTQEAVDHPQRQRIAYEELQPGDIIQEGDEWQHESGRWKPFASLDGSCVQVRHTQRARRPYRVSTILEIGNALANAQKAATQLQNERDEFQTALIESRLALKRKVAEVMEVCKERDEALAALAQAREGNQQLLKTIAENADMFGDHTKALVQERDEARTELQRVQEVVINLYDEPTARQVQQMLRTWATELDWSAGCFDSAGREQIDTIQKTLVAVIERIEGIVNPEGGSDGE